MYFKWAMSWSADLTNDMSDGCDLLQRATSHNEVTNLEPPEGFRIKKERFGYSALMSRNRLFFPDCKALLDSIINSVSFPRKTTRILYCPCVLLPHPPPPPWWSFGVVRSHILMKPRERRCTELYQLKGKLSPFPYAVHYYYSTTIFSHELTFYTMQIIWVVGVGRSIC